MLSSCLPHKGTAFAQAMAIANPRLSTLNLKQWLFPDAHAPVIARNARVHAIACYTRKWFRDYWFCLGYL